MMKRLLVALAVSAILAGILYIVFISIADREATLAALWRLEWQGWVLVLLLSLVNYAFRFYRWQLYIVRLSGVRVPFLSHLGIYFSGFALTTTPGKVGEAIRAVYLKKYGIRYPASFSALFVERLIDVLVIAMLTTMAAIAMPGVRVYAVLALLVVGLMVLAVRRGYAEQMVQWLEPWLPGRIRGMAHHLVELLRDSSRLLKTRYLYAGLGLGLLSWAAEGIGLYCILYYLGATEVASVSLPLVISIYALAVLAGALSFIPGGLLAAETSMYLLLTAVAGVSAPEAMAATLICRVATLWFAVILGLAPFAVLSIQSVSPVVIPGDES